MTRGPDDVPGGVFSLSDDMRILSANRAMGELVRHAPETLVGRSLDVLLSAPSRILFQTNVYPALRADGHVEEVLLTLAEVDGATTPILLNAVRSEREAGTYDGLIVRFQARATWERELLAATRALEAERAASRQLTEDLAARFEEERRDREFRDAFVGVISHELRTPITTIYGMSHLLHERHESMDAADVRQRLHDIEAEADRLRRLTEDLLVLSRAEGGRLQLADDPVVIWRVVQSAVDSERRRLPGLRCEVDMEPGLPLVLGEDLYIEQVVRNFLSNAAKYGRPDATVSVSARGEDGGVAVRVIDDGPGFGEQPSDRLFELFYRAPEAIRHASGAGIGLFVVRELIAAMGGRVWAAPASTGGAEFGFWLPAAVEVDDGES